MKVEVFDDADAVTWEAAKFIAAEACTAVAGERVDRGVAICGSGVGASVCANKVRGIRPRIVSRDI